MYLFIGDGYLAFRFLIEERGLDNFMIEESFHFVKGRDIAECGLEGLKAGKGIDPISVEPLYLRRPEVEIKLEEKMKQNDKC